MICHCCDLWQMSDTDNLMVFTGHLNLLRHHLCCSAADSAVNLIKNQCLDFIMFCQNRLQSQHNAGQLTAGSYCIQRFERFAWIRGNHKSCFIPSIGSKMIQS